MAIPRIGVVGIGTFGINHLRCFRQLGYIGAAELVAAADLNEKLLDERSKEFNFTPYADYHEMLAKEKLDGITVVTPDPFHKDVVLAAAEAGVNVLCEKPLDVTVDGCQQMIDACEKAGILLMVDFHKRYDEYHIAMKQKIDAGDFGAIQYGYAHMEDRIEVPKDWFPGWAVKSSPAWFLGIHFYDLARYLIGSDGAEVWATGCKARLQSLGVDTWDSVSAKVTFKNGATVSFDTSWILPYEFEAVVNQGIRLVGTHGMLECDSQDRGTITCISKDAPGILSGKTAQAGMETHNKSFLRQKFDKQGREIWEGYGMDSIADFAYNLGVLLDGAKIADLSGYPTGQDGLEATKIAAGVHKSLETGGIVKL
ncbi:MAG: Gfo/Idh/MocA family oxidoreductase [Armatimonadia bacterium]